ncbi:MAG: hypothetical protein RPV21_08635 [Candidatus Sedimenticola sp. (ex Thyasira tokunagai)]
MGGKPPKKKTKREHTLAKMAEPNSQEARCSAAISYASTHGLIDPTFRSVLFTAKEKVRQGDEMSSNGGKSTYRSPVIKQAILEAVRKIGTTEAKLVMRYLEKYKRDTPFDIVLGDKEYIVFVEDDKLCRLLADGLPAKDRGRDISLVSIPNILTELKKSNHC